VNSSACSVQRCLVLMVGMFGLSASAGAVTLIRIKADLGPTLMLLKVGNR
jgi:hypothetical protein